MEKRIKNKIPKEKFHGRFGGDMMKEPGAL
jgi:hypothetical protein